MKIIKYIVLLGLLSGCSLGDSTDSQEDVTASGSEIEILAKNLDIPWTIAKQDERFYLTQRSGKIIEIESDNKTSQEVAVTKKVQHEGEGGLLGFILAPDFKTTKQAYAYHTYKENNLLKNRVVLLKKQNQTWVEKKVILEDIPGGVIHNGGRLKIGPDNMLYATTGDSGNTSLSQDKNSLAGKILRMTLDGHIPEDNPFSNSYVYSYGHRNPQGLVWDEKGTLYSTEHGQSAHDEINLIKPGSNYGWPVIQGDEKAQNMESPLYHTGEDTWAPSGIDYSNGKLYIATLRGEKIQSFDLTTKDVDVVHSNSGRMRDILIKDDILYSITSNRDGRGNPSNDDDLLIKLTGLDQEM
ncbi:glucose/arabinose dehydrogenase [Metabacillus crassostreae]|uniref:PQQ-dependent sugar dehydrogenase n=1 Tax=Metabacillus crassostreae TaxID=929098 RepID=UPI0019579240|nr:PQQ-dependent sugar dehydrogenase [Metabacillus crassostreae]MBM7602236.1 glucose/arabinose dehydrogenase [Metabacillus crassostreae]